ncbi:MAG: DUF542 domain-containing protein [Chitinophagaceae bacterium]|nr:DUF542 domain-containing protein [Chitinophagaceae bacterium]
MFLRSFEINGTSPVEEIVAYDYRTADVFSKYSIEYSSGGNRTLETACEGKGIDMDTVKKELQLAMLNLPVSHTLDFDNWDIDFLTDYIVNVHHQYIRKTLPLLQSYLSKCSDGRQKKIENCEEIQTLLAQFVKQILPHLQQEEEIIFPYIRQIAHAYYSRESYASLLVRTLRKPVEDVMKHEHNNILRSLGRMRQLTNNYVYPANAHVSHKVAFLKMKEFDNDLMQHMHLENNILFPRAIAMEKELLLHKD